LKDSNPSHGSEKTAPCGIECRLSDGLSAFKPGEVDSIIIAGMGGILMDRILRNGIEVVKSATELILSPHRDAPLLREFSNEFGFTIVSDIQIEDKKKTYTILKIVI
ncbi:MAG: tRNA (adenine(22)-N(1))-methyltransferase TrmK, partial [Parasporobacterium sp.]|nr:tRNA (adenine(22)-N(1))-methyltransferase TrmK [Parasporobacterium sp.]